MCIQVKDQIKHLIYGKQFLIVFNLYKNEMIAYKVLRCVIRDKIWSKTKSSPRQFFFVRKKIVLDFVSDVVLDFQCALLSCLGQINAYHH